MASDLVQRLRDAALVHPTIPLALARIEQLEAQRSQEWVDEAMRLAARYSWAGDLRDLDAKRAALLAHLTGETK